MTRPFQPGDWVLVADVTLPPVACIVRPEMLGDNARFRAVAHGEEFVVDATVLVPWHVDD